VRLRESRLQPQARTQRIPRDLDAAVQRSVKKNSRKRSRPMRETSVVTGGSRCRLKAVARATLTPPTIQLPGRPSVNAHHSSASSAARQSRARAR